MRRIQRGLTTLAIVLAVTGCSVPEPPAGEAAPGTPATVPGPGSTPASAAGAASGSAPAPASPAASGPPASGAPASPATGSPAPASGAPASPAPASGAPASPATGSLAPATALAQVRYTCGGRFPFLATALNGPGGDELAPDPWAAALRAFLARDEMDIAWLPDAGWTLLGTDANGAAYLARDESDGLVTVGLTLHDGAWTVTGWGDCTPFRVLPPDLGTATWELAPDQAIDRATRTFVALVTERECASGRSSAGRIVGPDVIALDGAVLVSFAVRPLGGGAQTCQGNPATPVTVELPEPLGPRALLDGSSLPPRELLAAP